MSCCEEFARQTGERHVGFEWADGWQVNGCCGGGCYVLQDIKFCPFCGAALAPPEAQERGDHKDHYHCAICGGVFAFAWSDEEAQAEARSKGIDPNDDCVVVCEDCYQQTRWGRHEGGH